jgi:hypothetical protein
MKIKGNDKASQTKCRFPNLGEMSVIDSMTMSAPTPE